MPENNIYAFSKASDLPRVSNSVRYTEARTIGGGNIGGFDTPPFFAKVTSIIEETGNKQAKAVAVLFNGTTAAFEVPDQGWIFDSDNTGVYGQENIYSTSEMAVNDIVEVVQYVDTTDVSQWLVMPSGGGAERPVIMAAGDEFEFGAIITSPTDETALTVFTAEQSIIFKTLLPWGAVADVPDDFKFVGDLNGTTYYTESYPKTIWCRPNETYPTVGGITNFDLLDSKSQTATVFATPAGAELILDDFDNVNASTQSRAYFNGKLFACSFNFNDGNFYLDFPLIGN